MTKAQEQAANAAHETCDFLVVRFHDSHEHKRWFMRDAEELGHITSLSDGGVPLDKADVLRCARETFGADVAVLWP